MKIWYNILVLFPQETYVMKPQLELSQDVDFISIYNIYPSTCI